MQEYTFAICTKGRYHSTLQLALISAVNQTVKPKKIIVIQDSHEVDLFSIAVYRNIFKLMENNGIQLEIRWGNSPGNGLAVNRLHGFEICQTELLMFLDDDCYLEADVMEKLLPLMAENVGAVGCSIIDPFFDQNTPEHQTSSQMADIQTKFNSQWVKREVISEVEHLYSTFLFRKSAATPTVNLELSKIAHREDTIFSHQILKNGYKLLVNHDAVIHHLRDNQGGIRSFGNEQLAMQQHDEAIFQRKLNEWNQPVKPVKYIVLNNGIGDQFAFKSILPEVKAKYSEYQITIASAHTPEIFEGEGVNMISIAQAQLILGNDLEKYNVYRYMMDNKKTMHLTDAYRSLYL